MNILSRYYITILEVSGEEDTHQLRIANAPI